LRSLRRHQTRDRDRYREHRGSQESSQSTTQPLSRNVLSRPRKKRLTIEKISKGEQISIVDWQEFSEDPQFAFTANEVKKAWKREQPKVYRNGTGKRYFATKRDLTKATHEEECDIQAIAEEDNEVPDTSTGGDD